MGPADDPRRGHALEVRLVAVVSHGAALALLVAFFGAIALLRRLGALRLVGSALAALSGGSAWYLAVSVGQWSGAVSTEEARFHHLYVLFSVGLPIVGFLLGAASLRRPPAGRTSLIAVWTTVAALLVPAGIGVWATYIEPNWLRVDHQTVSVGAAWSDQPIRVGVIADIQTDSFGDYERSAIESMLAERPDVILVAGDNTQLDWSDYLEIRPDLVALLASLEAPHGVFAIAGNTDPSSLEVARVVVASGHVALTDEVFEFEVRGQSVRLAGLAWPNNDRVEARSFVTNFASTASPDTIDILLSHSPDAILNVVDASSIDLVVSGHTHGGQIALPVFGPLWNVTELPRTVAGGGVHEVRGATLYVSTGVGVQRGESPKVRFGVRPSIGVLTLGS